MGQDCWPWELERSAIRVEWEDQDSGTTRCVIVDSSDKQWAINRAWHWCPKEHRPESKGMMRAIKTTTLL